MAQYRVSEETEARLRKFLKSKQLGDIDGNWVVQRGPPAWGAYTFDDAIGDLLTWMGF